MRPSPRRSTVIAAAVLIGALAGAARGDDKKEADRHFKNGVSLFGEAKYAEALAEFERAYNLKPHPLVLYNLAGAHRALSHYGEAVAYYQRFLDEGKGLVDPKRLAQGRAELDELMKIVAQVVIAVEPADATVTVDGREAAAGEAPLILGPGDHTVTARKDGYRDGERTFRVAAGDSLRVELTLEVPPPEPPPEVTPPPVVTPPPTVVSPPVAMIATPRRSRFGVGGALGVNALAPGDTGAPVVGVMVAPTDRLELAVDLVLVAYAAVPAARFRLAGDALSLHAVAAVPIAFTDGGESSTFAALAGGLGVRYRASRALALRFETWLAWAGSTHGTTMPSFAGAELWF